MLGECKRCHQQREMTRHHILPRCRGGNSEPENIVRVCRPCHDVLDAALGLRSPDAKNDVYDHCRKCGDFTSRLKAGFCRACVMPASEREQRELRGLWVKREMAGFGSGADSLAERVRFRRAVNFLLP